MTLTARILALSDAIAAFIRSMVPRLVPPGGTVGQVLTKGSATDYDATWGTAASGGGGSVDPDATILLTRRGYVSAKPVMGFDAANAVGGIGHQIYSNSGNDNKVEAFGSDFSTGLHQVPGANWFSFNDNWGIASIGLILGDDGSQPQVQAYSPASFKGITRFIDYAGSSGRFFVGLCAGASNQHGLAANSAWANISGIGVGFVGVGYEPSDTHVQLVYKIDDEQGVIRQTTGIAKADFVSKVWRFKMQKNPAGTHVLCTLVNVTTGHTIFTDIALPITLVKGNGYSGFRMSIAKGTADTQDEYGLRRGFVIHQMIYESDF